ncbi:MAG: hypothetical protein U9O49_02575 [Candidatus Thermoplasmatota archaeon]|nr:hypothetical protein [Candidatus Thermoplasmatota archaeon]
MTVSNDKIHIKVELGRDKISGNLSLITVFDENAPNFSKDSEGYYWIPTIEEKDFINEAFDLLPATKTNLPEKNIKSELEVKKPLKPKEDLTPSVEGVFINDKSSVNQDKIVAPEIKQETDTQENTEQTRKEAVFEVTKEGPNDKNNDGEKKDRATGIFRSADANAIDLALEKRKEQKEEDIVEADEQTIIDRVLSQKKKGKWNKNR